MKITVVEDGCAIHVALDGNLDFSASSEFKTLVSRLMIARQKQIIFDLEQVARIDSVGLGLLHIAREELGETTPRIRLKSPRNGVIRMLTLTEAANDFDIVP